MAGNYEAFAVMKYDENGVLTQRPAIDVDVRIKGEVADAAESPLTTNADGEIVAGSIAAATAGDILIFRVENDDGSSSSVTQVAT